MNESEITYRLVNELEVLEAELEVALQIARSRFKLMNRGILARIFGGIIERRPSLHVEEAEAMKKLFRSIS